MQRLWVGLCIVSWVWAGAAGAAPLLRVDVNDATATANTQPGFTPLLASDQAVAADSYSKIVNGVLVNLNVTAGDSDRLRATPVNGGSLTQAQLYQDFAFSAAADPATLSFGGLNPGAQYELVVWSFDSGSATLRMSDWAATVGTGNNVSYQFAGATLPTNDFDNTFTMLVNADMLGNLTIRGISTNPLNGPGVFVNAFQLTQVAVPESSSLAAWSLACVAGLGMCKACRRRRHRTSRIA